MEEIVLVGGGGHCRSCIDVIETEGRFNIVGIIDSQEDIGKTILGYSILGSDEDLPNNIKKYRNTFITIGQIKNNIVRKRIYDFILTNGGVLPIIISPLSHIAKETEIKSGTIIMHGALVNSNACIGYNCIINSGSIIEHEVMVGDFSHVSTGAILNGQVIVGRNVFIGSNAIVINNIKICDDVVVGAGAVVTKNINHPGIYCGNPVRRIDA